jgi:hypothetical protein
MKKLLVFALMLSVVQLGAQSAKDIESAVKAYEKAKAEVDGKKATDPVAWARMGKTLVSAYDVPTKNLWKGMTALDGKLVLKDQRAMGTETKTIEGEQYEVVTYPDKVLYYNIEGALSFWQITRPVLSVDMLNASFQAYKKAVELDQKGSLKKDLVEGFSNLQIRYGDEAMAYYFLGEFSKASVNFIKSVECGEQPAIGVTDTLMLSYGALTAFYAKEYKSAISIFERLHAMGFTQDGSFYPYLSDSYKSLDDKAGVEKTLIEGFSKFPSNQGILVSLINMYMENDENPEKILDYIRQAQANEPTNASLYSAEGDIWKKLGNNEKSIEALKKSVEVNANYAFGYYGIGIAYYDIALEIQGKANDEMDQKKYEALIAEMDTILEAAIEPFEKCFGIAEDVEMKRVVADYLKNIYFRLRANADYEAAYNKYKEISESLN